MILGRHLHSAQSHWFAFMTSHTLVDSDQWKSSAAVTSRVSLTNDMRAVSGTGQWCCFAIASFLGSLGLYWGYSDYEERERERESHKHTYTSASFCGYQMLSCKSFGIKDIIVSGGNLISGLKRNRGMSF